MKHLKNPALPMKATRVWHIVAFRTIGFVLVAFAAFIVAYLGPVLWVMRDGLLPDGVRSEGIEALHAFAESVWPLVALAIVLLLSSRGLFLPANRLQHR